MDQGIAIALKHCILFNDKCRLCFSLYFSIITMKLFSLTMIFLCTMVISLRSQSLFDTPIRIDRTTDTLIIQSDQLRHIQGVLKRWGITCVGMMMIPTTTATIHEARNDMYCPLYSDSETIWSRAKELGATINTITMFSTFSIIEQTDAITPNQIMNCIGIITKERMAIFKHTDALIFLFYSKKDHAVSVQILM